jgi:hypothetical protein
VLVALIQLGSATVTQVSRFVGIERANIYRVLEALRGRRLAVHATGPERSWSSPGRDEVVDILIGEEDARHRAARAEADHARRILGEIAPETPRAALPYVQLVSQVTEVSRLYDRLLGETEAELLVCNKAPYGRSTMKLRASVVDAMMRGIQGRALYESYELDDAGAEALRQTRLVYHEVGVDGRVVERLPVRLAVFDRRRVLLAMNDPALPDGFPTNLFVDHPDFAEFAALSFEELWASARRYRTPSRSDTVISRSRSGGAIPAPVDVESVTTVVADLPLDGRRQLQPAGSGLASERK